jgi:long-chain acyl-CoA synthetase
MSRDRLDFLGKEFAVRVLDDRLRARFRAIPEVDVLATSLLEHVAAPLARCLSIPNVLCNRLEFRDGIATGRLLDPVVRRGRYPAEAIGPSTPPRAPNGRAIVVYGGEPAVPRLSVRQSLAHRRILHIGATGFIGKVWLAQVLRELPEIGKVCLLVRPRAGADPARRIEELIAESPVFEGLDLARIATKIEVVPGDICSPGLGLEPETRARLLREIDLVVNSAGITDFTPDLRSALSVNVEATIHVLDFVRESHKAALLHLSTCFVAGRRNGRVHEEIQPDYTPAGVPGFDAEAERQELHRLIREECDDEGGNLRQRLIRLGMERAQRYGWPNTYTFTKSLAESEIQRLGVGLPIAIVRPSIVETSTHEPFRGWNEGINTSAPLSYLLGTLFRQLPSKKHKRLDVVPVDLVGRGMTLIAAALVERCHSRIYQLATSSSNPCDIGRSIELTGLAHRKHYRSRPGLPNWLRTRLDTIPVSRGRYRAFSAPGQKRVIRALGRVLPFARAPLRRAERSLDRVEKLIELYEPFISGSENVFEADRVELLSSGLSADDRARFGYDSTVVHWPEYFIDIHVPALRRWSWPLMEGKPAKG